MVVNSQQHMVVALLSEKLRLLPSFLFSIRSWEGRKALPDMAKVKPTVPDRYRTPVRLVVGRFLQSGKRRNNEASCYALAPFFCFYRSDVLKFLPVTSTFCAPPPHYVERYAAHPYESSEILMSYENLWRFGQSTKCGSLMN
jgi:hypothetical protein